MRRATILAFLAGLAAAAAIGHWANCRPSDSDDGSLIQAVGYWRLIHKP